MEDTWDSGLNPRILQLEKQIQKLESELSKCRELEEQLVQAQKRETLASLSGGIAHDFNNILHCILGYTELAQLKKQDENSDYKILMKIQSIVQKGQDLAERFLVFGRKSNPQRTPLNFNTVVKEVECLLERTIPRTIEIDRKLEDKLHFVNADPGQCEQVVMNLCINAMDAMPDGGQLTLQTENLVLTQESPTHLKRGIPPGVYVHLSVADTGRGIREDILKRVFEPFFTTKEKGHGTGLGLSVISLIVKSHGGYIGCENRQVKGSAFHVYFPALIHQSTPKDKIKSDFFTRSCPGKELILFVEDEEAILDIGEQFLQSCGYSVLTAQSCEEGLVLYNKNPVDLVLMDVGMPRMGGGVFLECLQNVNPYIKVLAISGYSDKTQTIKALDLDSEAFLPKPFRREELLHRVRILLDRNEMSKHHPRGSSENNYFGPNREVYTK